MTTKTKNRTDKLRAAHDKLQAAVAEIVSADDWKRMLEVASKFPNYSLSESSALRRGPRGVHLLPHHRSFQ